MNQADTAWMLISTALVLLMTPALAFFYGGLVRSKNALNTMMMSFISLGFVGVLWAVIGYSLAFAPGNDWIGDTSRLFLRGVGLEAQGTIPALSVHVLPGHVRDHHRGADLRRDRRAHAVLGLRRSSSRSGRSSSTARSRTGCGAAAGWRRWARSTSPAAPSCTSTPASRRSSPRCASASGATIKTTALLPHNVPFTLLGAGLLWFGWFGFNAGSALGRQPDRRARVHDDDPRADGHAASSGRCSTACGTGKPTAVGAATAIVVGLVAVTPAAGFIGPMSAIALGGDRRRPELLRAAVARQDVARRLARRRRGARRRRHGRRAADRRLRAEGAERRRRRPAVRQPGAARHPGDRRSRPRSSTAAS